MDKERTEEIERRLFDLGQEKKCLLSELTEIRHHDLSSLPSFLGIPVAKQPPGSLIGEGFDLPELVEGKTIIICPFLRFLFRVFLHQSPAG